MLQIQNNPWLGLASYQEKDAELFFGRKREIALLCEVIKQNYSTVIYGKSGMGKTSLINAGLIPLLNNDSFLPVSIKLEHNSSRSYTQQIIEAVTCKLEEHGCEVENDARLDAIMPDGVIPFQIDKNRVGELFRRWMKGRWLTIPFWQKRESLPGKMGTGLPVFFSRRR